NVMRAFAQNRTLLLAIVFVGIVLMIWAVIRAFNRPKRAIPPALPGLLFLGFAIAVVIRFPFVLGLDTDHPERLADVNLSTSPPASADWPQWRGPNRDGLGRAPGLRLDWAKSPPQVLWRAPIGKGYSSLAIVGERIYTQDLQPGKERVVCLSAADGKE